MRPKLILWAVSAIAIGAASSVSALTVTDIGVVSSGTDGLGLFGPAGADLAGDPYIAVFTYDLSKADKVVNSVHDSLSYGYTPAFLSVTVSINGRESSAPVWGIPFYDLHTYNGEIEGYNGGSSSYQSHSYDEYYYVQGPYADYQSAEFAVTDRISINNASIPLNYTMPGVYYIPPYNASATFSSSTRTDCEESCDPPYVLYPQTLANINLSSVGIAPEPATWVTMLVGFVGLGLLGFRNAKAPSAPLSPDVARRYAALLLRGK